MGGRVGAAAGRRHPARVERLVLACTTPGGRHAVERGHDVRAALAQPDLAARRAALLDLMYTPAYAAAHGPTSRCSAPPGWATTPGAATCGSAPATTRGTCCPAVTAPTLVLHGSDDLMSPVGNAELLAGRIPGAELQVYDGLRHGFFDELPRRGRRRRPLLPPVPRRPGPGAPVTEPSAYFVPAGPGRYRPTAHTGGAWSETEQHISPLGGLVVHAIEEHVAAAAGGTTTARRRPAEPRHPRRGRDRGARDRGPHGAPGPHHRAGRGGGHLRRGRAWCCPRLAARDLPTRPRWPEAWPPPIPSPASCRPGR